MANRIPKAPIDKNTQARMYEEMLGAFGLPADAQIFVLPAKYTQNPSMVERMGRAHMQRLTAEQVVQPLGSTFGNVVPANGVPSADITRSFCIVMFAKIAGKSVPNFYPGSSQTTTKVNFPLPEAFDAWANARNSRAADPDVQTVAGAFPGIGTVALSPNGATTTAVRAQYVSMDWQQPNPQGGEATRSIIVAGTAPIVDPSGKDPLGSLVVAATTLEVFDGETYKCIIIPAIQDASGQLAPMLWELGSVSPPAFSFTGTASTRVTCSSSYKGDGIKIEDSAGNLIS